jgi:hypothetical protein
MRIANEKNEGQNVKAVAFKLHEPLHYLDGASCRGGLSRVARSDMGDGWSKSPLVSLDCAMELRDRSLPKKSWVKISQIRTLSVKRIGRKIAPASEEELALVIEGLDEIIGG